jgi:hypothetical protein
VVSGKVTWKLFTPLGQIDPQRRSSEVIAFDARLVAGVYFCFGDVSNKDRQKVESRLLG